MSIHPNQRRLTPVIVAWAILPCAGAAALGAMLPQPSLLWNRSPSEPTGLYIRSVLAPAKGRIIAFRAPDTAFPYADRRMGYLRRIPILKEIAAGEGDLVCARKDGLSINGQWRAPVFARDPRGAELPQWGGCRTLGRGEFFVFSNRIANSFDSRYFGPVTTARIMGVFEPFMVGVDGAGAV